jgi:hypothetical protein
VTGDTLFVLVIGHAPGTPCRRGGCPRKQTPNPLQQLAERAAIDQDLRGGTPATARSS